MIQSEIPFSPYSYPGVTQPSYKMWQTGRKSSTKEPRTASSSSPSYSVMGRELFCCSWVRTEKMHFILLPTCFQKGKKKRLRFNRPVGKVDAVGRMISHQANMHVRELKPLLEELGREQGGRGKYAANLAPDRCSCWCCRYLVHSANDKSRAAHVPTLSLLHMAPAMITGRCIKTAQGL